MKSFIWKIHIDLLYEHPLITGLSTSSHKKPSYIPANKFALVLFDIVMNAGVEAFPVNNALEDVKALVDSISNPDQKKLATRDFEAILATAKQITRTQLGTTAVDSLKVQIQLFGEKNPDFKPAIELALSKIVSYYGKLIEEQRKLPASQQKQDSTLSQLRLGLIAMDAAYPIAKKALGTLLTNVEEYVKEGEQALATGRKNVETWFNDSMDRLSGWYKRRAQLVSFLIGFVVALSMNVDSINVTTALWREPTLRQVIVSQVDTYIQQDEGTLTPTDTPVPCTANTTPTTSEPTQTTFDMTKEFVDLKQKLMVLNIPLGWTLTSFETGGKQCTLIPTNGTQTFGISSMNEEGVTACKYISNFPRDWPSGLNKLVGLLITGAGAAQGAPFWFDILKKLINVRSTGPNPAEKPAG